MGSPISSRGAETRVLCNWPRARLARLGPVDRQLLLLLVSLGAEEARARLEALGSERRDLLAPLVAEIVALSPEERHALFACEWDHAPKPSTRQLNARLQRERPRLAALLVHKLSPRRGSGPVVPAVAADPAFARAVAGIAQRWLRQAQLRPT